MEQKKRSLIEVKIEPNTNRYPLKKRWGIRILNYIITLLILFPLFTYLQWTSIKIGMLPIYESFAIIALVFALIRHGIEEGYKQLLMRSGKGYITLLLAIATNVIIAIVTLLLMYVISTIFLPGWFILTHNPLAVLAMGIAFQFGQSGDGENRIRIHIGNKHSKN